MTSKRFRREASSFGIGTKNSFLDVLRVGWSLLSNVMDGLGAQSLVRRPLAVFLGHVGDRRELLGLEHCLGLPDLGLEVVLGGDLVVRNLPTKFALQRIPRRRVVFYRELRW